LHMQSRWGFRLIKTAHVPKSVLSDLQDAPSANPQKVEAKEPANENGPRKRIRVAQSV